MARGGAWIDGDRGSQLRFVCGFAHCPHLGADLSAGGRVGGIALRRRPAGVLIVCVVSALTAAKTLLIFLVEIVTGGEGVGHNATGDLLLQYVLPNSVWIVVPLVVAYVTGRSLLAAYRESPPSARS